MAIPPGGYETDWQQLRAFEAQNLPKSAMAVAIKIYAQAKSDGNQPEMIKALICILRYNLVTEAQPALINLDRLRNEATEAPFPANQILHSLLAEELFLYLQNHSNLQKKAEVDSSEQKLPLVHQSFTSIYAIGKAALWASVEPIRDLAAINLHAYDSILDTAEGSKLLRPSLYDFLAWRAIDLLEKHRKEEISAQPKSRPFWLTDEKCFGSAEEFLEIKVPNPAARSSFYGEVALYQHLESLHKQRHDDQAGIQTELARLDFARKCMRQANADSLYFAALLRLESRNLKTDSNLTVTTKLTKYIFEYGPYRWKRLGQATGNYELECERMCKAGLARFPQASNAKRLQYFIDQYASPDADLYLQANAYPQTCIPAEIEYRNGGKMWIRIVRRAPGKFLSAPYRSNQHTIKGLPAVLDTMIDLPAHQDRARHTFRFDLAGLPGGDYLVLNSENDKFKPESQEVKVQGLMVSSIAWMSRKIQGRDTEVLIVDCKSGRPVEGAGLAVAKRLSALKFAKYFKTDSMGILTVPSKLAGSYAYSDLMFRWNKERFYRSNYTTFGWEYPTNPATADTTVFFFTDRKLYRPGQKVFFKGIVVRDSLNEVSVVPNLTKEVFLTCGIRDTVFRKKFTSGLYGSFSGEIDLPKTLLNGSATLGLNAHEEVSIRIEDYKRPQFEILLDPSDSAYSLGETIKVSGKAITFSGAALGGAKVNYAVDCSIQPQAQDFLFRQGATYFMLDKTQAEGEVQTDANGHFEIQFPAIPDSFFLPEDQPSYQFTVKLKVSSMVGETHEQKVAFRIDQNNFELGINFPGQVFKEDFPVCEVSCKNYQEAAIRQMGEFRVLRLEAAKNSNPDTWTEGNVVLQGKFDTGDPNGLPLGVMARMESGPYRIHLMATSKEGKKLDYTHDFDLFGKLDQAPPIPRSLWLMEDQTTCEPGDSASFWVGTSEDQAYLLYEWEHQNRIVHREWIPMKSGVRQIKVPITDAYLGGLTIHCTLYHDHRYFHEAVRIAVPWTDKQLKLQFSTFRDKISPGTQEEWQLKVSGAGKEAFAAELMATMYDASLDAISKHAWRAFAYPQNASKAAWHYKNQGREGATFNFYPKHPEARYPESKQDFDSFDWMGYNLNYKAWRPYVQPSTDRHFQMPRIYLPFRRWFHLGKRFRNLPPRRGVRTEYINEDFDSDNYVTGENVKPDDGEYDKRKLDLDPKEISYGMNAPREADPNVSLLEGDAKDPKASSSNANSGLPSIRKNLQELAFFFPDLHTDAESNILLKFTSPEALTRWRFMAYAHTPDMKAGYLEANVITQKQLMIVPHLPRFFREGDQVVYSATITNLSDHDLQGNARLELMNAKTNAPIDMLMENVQPNHTFTVPIGQSIVVSWALHVPAAGLEGITHRVTAITPDFSDGEESATPVLSKRVFITDAVSMVVGPREQKTFEHIGLHNLHGATAQPHQVILEFSTNPAWQALLSLPYVMEFPHECSEQTFARFYANTLAAHCLNQYPRLKELFAQMKATGSTDLKSNLERNQDLKTVLLQETPWLQEAKDETERIQRLGMLFNLDRLAEEQALARQKLLNAENERGEFSWFPGMKADRHLGQHILSGLGHLVHLGALDLKAGDKLAKLVERSLRKLDKDLNEDFDLMERDTLSPLALKVNGLQIKALYARSFFPEAEAYAYQKKVHDYYLEEAKAGWSQFNVDEQAMIGLILHRAGDEETPAMIMASLKERARHQVDKGMFWLQENNLGEWENEGIQRQAMLIELFDEVGHEEASIVQMKSWLLSQKQTQHWSTTKATTEACYALLLAGGKFEQTAALPKVTVGGQSLDLIPRYPGFTDFVDHTWTAREITSDLGFGTVTNSSDATIYGTMYWQYFQDIDQVQTIGSGFHLQKELLLETQSATGIVRQPLQPGQKLHLGDKVVVRLTVDSDRDMDYVHLRDQRPAAFEPVATLSGYKWEYGLGRYETMRDASANFFFDRLPSGHHVIEYKVFVSHKGDFAGGITTVQCMYAPLFTATLAGIRVSVE